MILDHSLSSSDDETELTDPYIVQLLKDKLQHGLQARFTVHASRVDRKHLFQLLLGGREKTRSQTRRWNYRLINQRFRLNPNLKILVSKIKTCNGPLHVSQFLPKRVLPP
jgi:hypothetical protein